MNTLTDNAKKLYDALKLSSIWEDDAIKVLFPQPKYLSSKDTDNYSEDEIKAAQMAYWQWDANLYSGKDTIKPVLGQSVTFTPTENYFDITNAAWKELKAAGLGYSKNGGYNNYSYHLK